MLSLTVIAVVDVIVLGAEVEVVVVDVVSWRDDPGMLFYCGDYRAIYIILVSFLTTLLHSGSMNPCFEGLSETLASITSLETKLCDCP